MRRDFQTSILLSESINDNSAPARVNTKILHFSTHTNWQLTSVKFSIAGGMQRKE